MDLPVIINRFTSADGTQRYLLRLNDGETVECVLIPRDDRMTFCISSQVGCALGCTFCLTGQLGLTRDLSTGEIVAQVMLLLQESQNSPPKLGGVPFARFLANGGVVPQETTPSAPASVASQHFLDGAATPPNLGGESFRQRFSVVLMGMGEPLQNYDNVLGAIRVLHDDRGLKVPMTRITVSTAGLVPGIERLAGEPLFPNLSISLTGVTNKTRDDLMPVNRKYPIESVMEVIRKLPSARQKRVMFECVMIKGVTDSPEDAEQLSRLVSGMRVKVNLIPLNPAEEIPFERPEDDTILRFQEILIRNGTATFIRKNRGNDISGACGQLKKTTLAGSKP